MIKVDLLNFPNCSFGKNVTIETDNIDIKDGAKIGNNVYIRAKSVIIGYDSVIEKNTVIKGLDNDMDLFHLGDNTFIGFSNQILVPEFVMLDYSQLHNSGLHTGYKPLRIGYNCWIGQNSILNSTENLTMGNNVRIGTQSQLWTHVASGELLEGCTLYGSNPLLLKDNVWLVGGAVISPGLILGENSIIMTGSVLTKNTDPFNTYAGIPAKNVTEKLNFWKKNSLEDKAKMVREFIESFIKLHPHYRNEIFYLDYLDINKIDEFKNKVVIVKEIDNIQNYYEKKISLFDLKSKKYIKNRTKIEIDWIKFNVGFRARFIPTDNLGMQLPLE